MFLSSNPSAGVFFFSFQSFPQALQIFKKQKGNDRCFSHFFPQDIEIYLGGYESLLELSKGDGAAAGGGEERRRKIRVGSIIFMVRSAKHHNLREDKGLEGEQGWKGELKPLCCENVKNCFE